jgi:hypothetical protein
VEANFGSQFDYFPVSFWFELDAEPGLPDFSWYYTPKTGKMVDVPTRWLGGI